MAVNDIIGMLTGNPMGPQKQQPSVYANPFQSIMAGMDADAAATGAIGRTIQDGVRTMFGLPPRELTREEQFEDMLGGIEDLGSEEGFNQFLDAYAMVDPFAVEDIRRQRRLDSEAAEDRALRTSKMGLDMANTQQIMDARETQQEEKQDAKLTDQLYRTSLVEQAQEMGVGNEAINRSLMTAPKSDLATIFEGLTKEKPLTGVSTVFTEDGKIVQFGRNDKNEIVSIGDNKFDPNQSYFTSNPRTTEKPVPPIVIKAPSSNMRKTYETLLDGELLTGGIFGFNQSQDPKAVERAIYMAEDYRTKNDNVSPEQAINYALQVLGMSSGEQTGDSFSGVKLKK